MGLNAMMRRFSIRMRMLGAIGVVLALLGLVGSAGLYGMFQLLHVNDEFVDHSYAEVQSLGQLQQGLGNLRRYERDMIIYYDNADQVKSLKTKWDQSRQEVLRHMAAMLEAFSESTV